MTNSILSMKHVTRRVAATCAIALAAVAGCSPDQILDVTDPDILNVEDYKTAAGANALRNGVLSDFQAAFSGSIDGVIVSTGNMADEIRSTDTFEDRLSVSSRTMIENNPALLGTYRALHRARSGAETAAGVLRAVAPEPKRNIGEVFLYKGFAEVFFGEMYCSGVGFAKNTDGVLSPGPQLTTQQVFQMAVASLDTALLQADTSNFVRYAAQIGRARALLNLGQFAQAAAAVQGVPTTFQWLTFHSTNSGRQENADLGCPLRHGAPLHGDQQRRNERTALPADTSRSPRALGCHHAQRVQFAAHAPSGPTEVRAHVVDHRG
ncbi:MAG: hypothetical protein IPK85_09945 [Gemmatimonadetes bacterium]|nr:hypothetical protein [Gemmatimonadota bacterium]